MTAFYRKQNTVSLKGTGLETRNICRIYRFDLMNLLLTVTFRSCNKCIDKANEYVLHNKETVLRIHKCHRER